MVILKSDIAAGLREAGLAENDVAMVHTALHAFGYVCGGAQTVIEALLEVVGPGGTLMMPTQSWKNLDPSLGVHSPVPESEWQKLRDNWPPYDPQLTPTNTMGAVAELFRKWPGAIRSMHPARSVAALGPQAAFLTEHHELRNIFGPESPVDRLYQLNGKVVLLGVGYNKNTSLHLADSRASYPSKHNEVDASAILRNGKREWVTYETLYVDGEDFNDIGAAFERENTIGRSHIGNAEVRCMNQRALVDFATQWIERHRK